jgi:pyruvate dehydrogenase E2 component (dihydrolipoamide acetyltransferase)
MGDVKDFRLPDLGEGLEEGEIVAWLVAVGDVIALNQELVTVETAKAAVDVPSPFAGRVVEVFGAEGETLEVGAVLCRIDVEGGATAEGAAAADTPASSEDDGPSLGSGGSGSTGLDADTEPQPLVGYGSAGGEGSGRRRRRAAAAAATGTDAGAATEVDPGAELPADHGRPLAKPPVRRLAGDLGVDLADVAGSGPDGIVTRDDVHAHVAAQQAPAAPVAAPSAVAAPSPYAVAVGQGVPGFRGRVPGEVEKVTGIRKRIIEKMERSRRDIPHALCATDADMTALWDLRRVLTSDAQAQGLDVRVTPYVLVMRATVLALRRFPTLNAVYDQQAGEIRLLEHINLGLAVDTDRGLIVANIKDAQSLSTLQLAQEAARLAQACRDGSATPGELTGGTFTTDNYGWFGNDDGNPIINAPEVGILGISAMRERAWVVDGELAVRRVARLQLAFDHRVCDGGEAGRFVTHLAELCEQPARILLHA